MPKWPHTVNFRIARTHLLSRKRQTFIAMMGVTFGIAMFILMISFMKGVNQFLEDLMMSTTADIRIYNKPHTDYSTSITDQYLPPDIKRWTVVHHPRPKPITLKLKNAPGIIEDLQQSKNVKVISPLLSSLVIFDYGAVQWAANVDGVNILAEDSVLGLKEKMIRGEPGNLLKVNNGIIMGYKLAADLNITTGDLVTLTTQSGTQMRCRLVGLFKFGIATMDEYRAYVTLTTMQHLLGKEGDYITEIRLKLHDPAEAKTLAHTIARKYNYIADDWEVTNSSLKAGNIIRDTLTYVVSFTLLVVAGFGIYNIMNMTISNKMKDIAILKAQGFTGRDILQIFLSQSLVIGTGGGLAGLVLGFLMSYGMSWVPFPEDDYISLKYFPVLFESRYYIFGILFGITTTVLAGLLPSLKAARVDPVAILRS